MVESLVPKIVVSNPLKESIDNIFYMEWEKKLQQNRVFEENDTVRMVSAENMMKVLKAIDIE